MKKYIALIMVAVMIFSAVGCTKKTDEAASTELEDTVVVYSTHSEELLEAVSTAFTEKTGVKVEYINLKGELSDRVRSEKENPQADIMYGGDAATYTVLKNEGCYAVSNPSWAGDLDADLKDSEGYYYGTIKTPVMMFYNKDIITAEQAPKDWADLAKEEYKNLIVTRDSLSSSMRSCISSLVYHFAQTNDEETAWKFIENLDANTKNYYNSGSMMYEAIGKGEAAISIAVQNDIMTNVKENGMPFEIIDATSGSIILTDCIAKINNCPHPNAAEAFLEFAGSPEAQALIANDFNRIPTLEAALDDSPAWMSEKYKGMELDWAVISEKQTAWLDNWENNYVNTSKSVAKN